MKRTWTRSILVYIVALAFFAGLATFCARLVLNNEAWVQQPYNGHTAGSGGLAMAGKIYDRNGTVLAYTEDGGESWVPLPGTAVVSMNLWGFTPSFLKETEDRCIYLAPI